MKLEGRGVNVGPIMVSTYSPLFSDNTTPFIKTTMTREEQFDILDRLWDMGLRCFDASSVYGECLLGDYLKSRARRWDAILMTKGGAPNAYRNRILPFDILSDFYDSQKRLHRDGFDIYMLQRDDPNVPVEDIIPVLDTLQREGKIGIYGAANWSVDRIKAANKFAHEHGMTGFQVTSPHYSLAHQRKDPWGGCVTITGSEHEEDREWLKEQKMPVFAASPLSSRFLSGAVHSDDREGVKKIQTEAERKAYAADENFERLARTEELAAKYEVTVPQIAIAWLVKQELTVIPVLAGETVEMFEQAQKALEIPLTAHEVKWLNLEA